MKKLLIIPLLLVLVGCMSKFSEKRFDFTEIFPDKKEECQCESREEMHFGPGPGDEINFGPGPQDEVEYIPLPPPSEDSSVDKKEGTWWWE